MQVSLGDVWTARRRLPDFICRTPLVESSILSERIGGRVLLKLETLQPTGTFKVRGAANKMLSLTPEQRDRGVTTFSTGNHGRAVAYVARQSGIRAVVCLSRRVPATKVESIKRLGAEVEVVGESQDDAERRCYQLEAERGLTIIQPFDDRWIISGQGTIGLELLEDLHELDAVVVPLSGGGLICGIALAVKSLSPATRVIGVSMEHSAAMNESLRAGKPIVVEEQDTLADSLLGGIGQHNRFTFRMVQQYVDQVVLVSEQTIARGMAFMLDSHRMAVEGAAATGIGAVLQRDIDLSGGTAAVIVSGANVDTRAFLEVVSDVLGSSSSSREPVKQPLSSRLVK